MAEELDAETIAFAHRIFELARSGAPAELHARVAAQTAGSAKPPEIPAVLATHHGA